MTAWQRALGATLVAVFHLADGHSPAISDATSCQSEAWVGAVAGALLVGAVGILPLFLFRLEAPADKGSSGSLRMMLGCACGGLLGNAFLHLLPESYVQVQEAVRGGHDVKFWGMVKVEDTHHGFNSDMYIGLWILTGIVSFIILEKMVAACEDDEGDSNNSDSDGDGQSKGKGKSKGKGDSEDEGERKGGGEADVVTKVPLSPRRRSARLASKMGSGLTSPPAVSSVSSQAAKTATGGLTTPEREREREQERKRRTSIRDMIGLEKVDPAGYLNLLVNTLDNFTHGLAIAAAFCTDWSTGVTTTVAIVIHEVPHEVGDYAILVKSGFTKWKAITAQFLTSAGGIVGALYGLYNSGGAAGLWIFPFAAGGFIYIALVSLIPDLMKEESEMPWWRDALHVTSGALVVGYMAQFDDHEHN